MSAAKRSRSSQPNAQQNRATPNNNATQVPSAYLGNAFHPNPRQLEGGETTQNHRNQNNAATSADNKHGMNNMQLFDELNLPQGPSTDLIEMDQRQRIFEEVIISRIKVVQDFVKQKYGKLNQQFKDCRTSGLLASGNERLDFDDLNTGPGLTSSQAGTKGTIIEVVEEALKWRLEAYNRKQAEIMDDLVEKITQQKTAVDMLQNDSNTEIIELKNQIVDAASDVLL